MIWITSFDCIYNVFIRYTFIIWLLIVLYEWYTLYFFTMNKESESTLINNQSLILTVKQKAIQIFIFGDVQFILQRTKCKAKMFLINIVAAFRGMHVSPAKHNYAWLPRKCDYRTDTRTHIWTDRRRTKWSLCATMLRRRHNKTLTGKTQDYCHTHIINEIWLNAWRIYSSQEKQNFDES